MLEKLLVENKAESFFLVFFIEIGDEIKERKLMKRVKRCLIFGCDGFGYMIGKFEMYYILFGCLKYYNMIL